MIVIFTSLEIKVSSKSLCAIIFFMIGRKKIQISKKKLIKKLLNISDIRTIRYKNSGTLNLNCSNLSNFKLRKCSLKKSHVNASNHAVHTEDA